jgi:hypothetical protein
MDSLLKEARPAFEAARASRPEDVTRYIGFVTGYEPRAASMIKAYCR